MNYLLTLLGLTLLSPWNLTEAQPKSKKTSQALTFEKLTLPQALEKASKTHQMVFVDVSASWCGPCKQMKMEVFPAKGVGVAYAGLISIEVDGDTPEGEQIVSAYDVEAYPTFLFLNEKGEKVYSHVGYAEETEFVELPTQAKAAQKITNDLPGWFLSYNARTLPANEVHWEEGTWGAIQKKVDREAKPLVVELYDAGDDAMQTAYTLATEADLVEKLNREAVFVRTAVESELGRAICEQYGLDSTSVVCVIEGTELVSQSTEYGGAGYVKYLLADEIDAAVRLNSYASQITRYLSGMRGRKLLERLILARQEQEPGSENDHLAAEWLHTFPADSLADETFVLTAVKFDLKPGHPITRHLIDAFKDQSLPSPVSVKMALLWRLGQTLAPEQFTTDTTAGFDAYRTTIRELLDDSLASRTILEFELKHVLSETDTLDRMRVLAQWANYVLREPDVCGWMTTFYFKCTRELKQQAKANGQTIEEFSAELDETRPEFAELIGTLFSSMSGWEARYYEEVNLWLNSLAWYTYMQDKDDVSLKKALNWSKRSLDFDENHYSMDTCARLLYHFGEFEQAEAWMQKAVDMAKENEESQEEEGYASTLQQIRKRGDLR